MRTEHFKAAVLLTAALFFPLPQGSPAAAPKDTAAVSVYEGQQDFTEEELVRFTRSLPLFLSWARDNREQPHPAARDGRPDFVYSEAAGEWARFHGWDDKRFFCVMGRAAAALALVIDGEENQARYRDMPKVSPSELELARRHLGELLKAGEPADRR